MVVTAGVSMMVVVVVVVVADVVVVMASVVMKVVVVVVVVAVVAFVVVVTVIGMVEGRIRKMRLFFGTLVSTPFNYYNFTSHITVKLIHHM